jgi:predicted dehydrogenase
MVRYGEVPGTLLATMVAPGNPGGLRFRIIGDKASLAWDHENPEYLVYSRFGEPKQIISRGGGAGVRALAARGTRTPRGHSEGWIEAWANLYGEVAIAIEARREGVDVDAGALEYPTVEDGARGVKWVEAALDSDRAGGAWRDCSLSFQ